MLHFVADYEGRKGGREGAAALVEGAREVAAAEASEGGDDGRGAVAV